MDSSLLTPFLLNDFNPYQNRVWIIVCRKQAEENPEKSWLTVGIPIWSNYNISGSLGRISLFQTEIW